MGGAGVAVQTTFKIKLSTRDACAQPTEYTECAECAEPAGAATATESAHPRHSVREVHAALDWQAISRVGHGHDNSSELCLSELRTLVN